MADYRLTQSGDEVQRILNNATPQSELTAEVERAQQAEQQLQTNIDSEATTRQQADTTLQQHIDAEETRAEAAEQQNATDIDAIESKIPAAASDQNKLVDESKMNSSIATATATYRGSYNLVTDLHLTVSATEADIVNALAVAISQADNNDYCFVQVPVANDKPMEIARNDRYKFNGTVWSLEYTLNNSGFTSDQWAAINSGITSGLVALFGTLPAKVDGIEAKIPSGASSQNKLATEGFVNSSVATNTATFKGAYNLVIDLSLTISATQQQIATALAGAISQADNNDYCFVQIPDADATPTVIARVDRYKFDGTDWSFEYSLNNSGFTAAQWDAVNSGITSGLVSKLSLLPTEPELTATLQGKQAVIPDLPAIRSGAAAGATAYQKPASGIPETDLTVALQLALASFITATAQNLAYYYLKSETYSATQIDQMLAAIKQFTYESVQTLPTASAQTVGKIYLVPSADPQTQNVKDEFITLTITEQGTTTYAWEKIGSTDIDLTNYYTKTQADAAITAALNTALAAYSTTSQVSTMISTAINSALQAYATKEYVSSQVQEYAGTFRGTYDTLAELEATTGNHHNDYAWVRVTDSDGDNDYDRYKFNGTAWVFEYRLNNTHFTTDELAAIRSGMTTAKREKLDNLPATTSSSIAATTGAATISGAKKFFVGTQGQDGRWTLESLTPAEMQKCAYAYLAGATVGNTPAHIQGTDANGNPQRITPPDLASLLGVLVNSDSISSGQTDVLFSGRTSGILFFQDMPTGNSCIAMVTYNNIISISDPNSLITLYGLSRAPGGDVTISGNNISGVMGYTFMFLNIKY